MASWNPLRWLRRETKASAAGPAIAAFHVGQPVWSTRDYHAFADEGYVQNAIAFRCVSMVAQAVASVPLLLNDGRDKEIDDHPLMTLLSRPAPDMTGAQLLESVATYLQLAGNAYLEGVGPNRRDAPPRELWSLRPDRMRVIPGPDALPQGYEYEANGRLVHWTVDRVSGRALRRDGMQVNQGGTILHLKRFHPIDDWYGLSAVEPAAKDIDRHNEARKHNMAVLQNGATPSGALMFKPVKVDGQEVVAPDSLIAAAQTMLDERHAGTKNSGRPFVLGGNVDWRAFGMTMEQLQLNESKLDAARDICTAFGVPIELLLPGQSTYNNKREAKLGFYEETVLPLAEHLIDHLNVWLAPRFGDGLALKPNLDEIEALSLRREIRQKNTLELFTGGVIDRDEARQALQWEPRPDLLKAKVDPAVLTALAQNAADIGDEPLYRYLQSVGLLPAETTLEAFSRSIALLDDAEEAIAALTPANAAEQDDEEEDGADEDA